MTITNSCATGVEMPRTSNNQSYIYDNSHGDRVYRETAKHSKSQKANTSNYQKYCTSDLVMHYVFVFDIRVQSKVSNQTTMISIMQCIVTRNQRCFLHQRCLNNQNKHKSTRAQHTQSNQIREQRSFQQMTSNKIVLGPFIKKKDKRGLNTTDHVQYKVQ